MKVIIPKNMNVDSLIKDLNKSERQKNTIREKIFRLISKLVVTHRNQTKFDSEGYLNICSSELNRILNRDYKFILNLLKTNNIIEVYNSYEVGGRCKGYKLNNKYLTGEYIYESIKYNKKKDPPHMLDKYFNKKLKLTPNYKDEVIRLIEFVESRLSSDKQLKLFRNQVGSWILTCDDINRSVFWHKVSTTNHRYNTTLTGLFTMLRNYLKYDNQNLIQVDVKCSQMYVLASILNYDFFKSRKENSFHSLSNYIINELTRVEISSFLFSPLMFAQFEKRKYNNKIRPKDHKEFQKFRDAPFSIDFYSHIFKEIYRRNPSTKERDCIKSDIMYFLFQEERGHRVSIETINIIKRQYPFINRIVEYMNDKIGRRAFALLLQRAESYLILECVVPVFHKRYPTAPIFTIHDSVVTTEAYSDQLNEIMYEVLLENTGIKPGLTIDPLSPCNNLIELGDEIVEEIIKKSKPKSFKESEWLIMDRHIKLTENLINK